MIEDYGAIEAESRVDFPSCYPLKTERSWGRSLEESVSFPHGASIKIEEEIYHLPLTEFDPLLTIELPKGKEIISSYEVLLKELLGEEPYGKSKEPTKPSGKFDVDASTMEEKHRSIISIPTAVLEPSHMLDILQIKKFAKERGKGDWLTGIEKKESEYYEEISSFVKTSNRIMKRKQWEAKPMTIEEAKMRMKEFLDEMNRMSKEYKPDQVELKLIIKRFMEKIDLI